MSFAVNASQTNRITIQTIKTKIAKVVSFDFSKSNSKIEAYLRSKILFDILIEFELVLIAVT